jgi:hypothetical protein
MRQDGVAPTPYTLNALLKFCKTRNDLTLADKFWSNLTEVGVCWAMASQLVQSLLERLARQTWQAKPI